MGGAAAIEEYDGNAEREATDGAAGARALGTGVGARTIGVETGAGGREGTLTDGAGAVGLGAGVLFQNPHGLFDAVFAAGAETKAGMFMMGAGLGGSVTDGLAALVHTLDSG